MHFQLPQNRAGSATIGMYSSSIAPYICLLARTESENDASFSQWIGLHHECTSGSRGPQRTASDVPRRPQGNRAHLTGPSSTSYLWEPPHCPTQCTGTDSGEPWCTCHTDQIITWPRFILFFQEQMHHCIAAWECSFTATLLTKAPLDPQKSPMFCTTTKP